MERKNRRSISQQLKEKESELWNLRKEATRKQEEVNICHK